MNDGTLKNEFHTTLSREIRPDRNWHELIREGWQKAVTLRDVLGILHQGYEVSLERYRLDEKEYSEIDRHTFYFIQADGWANSYLLRLPEDGDEKYHVGYDKNENPIKKTLREIRQIIAQKAFDMLCLNFFNTEPRKHHERHDNDIWEKIIVSAQFFSIIQNFFRAEKNEFGDRIGIRNFPRHVNKFSHNEERMVGFIINLIKVIWEWEEYEIKSWYRPEEKESIAKHNNEVRSRLDSSRPWTIEILAELKRLNLLNDWIFKMNEASLAKLKEIALRNEFSHYTHPVKENRLVKSVDEACYLGSETAWFLKKYELKMTEHRRLVSILDAEQERTNAEEKIKSLTEK